MRTIRSYTSEGIDALKSEQEDRPGPLGPGQVRIAMKAASLNYRDLLVLRGELGPPGEQGIIPCSDGAGEVTEVGPDVQRVKTGDRVALTFLPDWIAGPWSDTIVPMTRGFPLQGVMRDEMVVHQSEAVVLPQHLSYEEGACLPCAAVTAWHSLCGETPLLPGMTVLLQGGGGVSVFALQFAKLFGARVIATSSSDERCQRLRELGADETINYRAVPEWNQTVRDLTDGKGADLTVEVGGAQTIERSLAATSRAGRLALVGLLSGWPNQVSNLFTAGAAISPIRVGSRADFEHMNRAIAHHGMRPVIDRTFAFEELADALRYLETGQQFGKIAIGFA